MNRADITHGFKNPADMSYLTLIHYYYDTGITARNWVFPIQVENGHKRRLFYPKPEMDSRPKEC